MGDNQEKIQLLSVLKKTLDRAASYVKDLETLFEGEHKTAPKSKQADRKSSKKETATLKDAAATTEVKKEKVQKKSSSSEVKVGKQASSVRQLTDKEKRKLYADAPKKRNAFLMFSAELRKKLKQTNQKFTMLEIASIATQKWHSMAEQVREQYKRYVDNENKTTYANELIEYKKIHPEYDQHKRIPKAKRQKKNKPVIDADLSEEA